MEQTVRTRDFLRAESARRQPRNMGGQWVAVGQQRARRVSVRLTEDEYQAASEQAVQLGVTVTEMLRGLLMDGYNPTT